MVPHFNAPAGGDPLRISEYPDKLTSPEARGIVLLPDAENRTIVSSFVWTQYRNVTDRQTGGQTDRIPLASTALCIASNADAL